MAQTIYTIVTINYYEHNMGTQKQIETRSFTDENQAKTYFRGNILSKLEELEYEDVDIPADSTDFNLYYACDDVEDDWFESKIYESVLD
jgi:hypothetical protein